MSDFPAAESTIAMSAYNVLAMSPGPMSMHALHGVLVGYHPGLPIALLDKAVRGLCERRYVRTVEGSLALVDSAKRMVRKRSREHDGWQGWMVQDKSSNTMIKIEQVIA